MTLRDLHAYREWFTRYTESFLDTEEADRRNIQLKIDHSLHVAENIVSIASGLSLSREEIMLAEAVGLFHDIGRFSQYAQYRTFEDRKSINHGLLGMRVLVKENVLHALPAQERNLLLRVVQFHNAYAIPPHFDDRSIFFLKMVRDADKVDIYRVFIEYYESPKEDRASATAFGVPDTEEYSKEMLACILEKRVASYSRIRTEHDFKLMQLSWVFDMNFKESIRLLQSKHYIDATIAKLPQTGEILSAMDMLKHYLQDRLQEQVSFRGAKGNEKS